MVLVSVLCAGLGMLEGMLKLILDAHVGFIGLRREETTLRTIFYHRSLPKNHGKFEVILIDPMLATGGSTLAAVDILVEQGTKHIRMVNLVATPEGIAHLRKKYPTLPISPAAVDKKLDGCGYILPGLGDAGDRLFGT